MAWVKQGTVPMFPNVYDFGVGSAVVGGSNGKDVWKLKNESSSRTVNVRVLIKKSGASEFDGAHTQTSNSIPPGGELSIGSINLFYTAYPTAADSFGVRADAYDDYPYIAVYKDVNTAPTTPGAFTQPTGELEIGDSRTISWGAASDTEGNLAGYTLEVSINGGGYTQIATPTQPNFNYTIPTATTLKFRVKARDNAGLESAYRESASFTVTKPKYYWSKYSVSTQTYYQDIAPWDVELGGAENYHPFYGLSKGYYFDQVNNRYSLSSSVWGFEEVPLGAMAYTLNTPTQLYRRTATRQGYQADTYVPYTSASKSNSKNYQNTSYSRGSLIQSGIIAVEGKYPTDGRHSDGFWYVRGSRANLSIAPTGGFSSPVSGRVYKPSETATIVFAASTAPNIALYEVDYKYGNGAWQTLAYNTALSRTLTITTDKALGNVQFRVRAKNTSNVYSDYVYSEIYTIQHNSAPVVTLTSPASNITLYENDTLLINGTALEVDIGNTVTVRYQVGAGTVRAIKAFLSTGTLEDYSKQLTFKGGNLYDGETLIASDLADGVAHSLKVWATDDKDGSSVVAERTFYVVPNRVPLLTVNTPVTEGNIDTDLININGTFSDPDANNAVVSYRINGGGSVQIAEGTSGAFDFSVSFGQLIIGDNIIVIEVIDSYGAKTSKTIKLNKKAIETPLLKSTQRYQLLPPSGSAVGVLFYIQHDAALDMDVSISMTQEAEAEQYTTLEPVTTAPISQGSGIVEDEYYHAAPEPAEKILLQIDFTRTSLTANEKIYVVMGAFE